jgi:DNA-binding YbaB/EbfC family protein
VKRARDELSQKEFDGSSGGGAVRCRVTGDMILKELSIDSAVLQTPDHEMLEDLVTTAVNDALSKARTAVAAQLKDMTGGLGLPPGLM